MKLCGYDFPDLNHLSLLGLDPSILAKADFLDVLGKRVATLQQGLDITQSRLIRPSVLKRDFSDLYPAFMKARAKHGNKKV